MKQMKKNTNLNLAADRKKNNDLDQHINLAISGKCKKETHSAKLLSLVFIGQKLMVNFCLQN